MVEDTHSHHLAGLTEPAGDLNVLLARGRIAAGMIVHENDRDGREPDHLGEDVARVKDRNGERAFADPSRNLGSEHSQGEFLVTPNEAKVLPVVREQRGADLPGAEGDQDIIEQRW